MREASHEFVAPLFIDVANVPRELSQRLGSLCFSLGAQQIRESFDLHQIDLVVVEGAFREFTGLCCPAVLRDNDEM
jgi:hypothetical protein